MKKFWSRATGRIPLDPLGRWALIGAVMGGGGAALAWAAGWLAPQDALSAPAIVDAQQRNAGQHPGFRRNHAKGVCVSGWFESSGAAAAYSTAFLFEPGRRLPVLGRFAMPGGRPDAPDTSVPIRSLALQLTGPGGQQWRSGMNSMPVFAVATPQAFYEQTLAQTPRPDSGKPDAPRLAAFYAAHPETAAFRAWARTARPGSSFAQERYNSLNAFYLVDTSGRRRAVRWSMVPETVSAGPEAAEAPAADGLRQDLLRRLAAGPLRWHLQLQFAAPGDPVDDATRAWPEQRPTVDAGTLVLTAAEPQAQGACRDINFDPTVLPSGIEVSGDPLLAARSAAYAESLRRRTAEEAGPPGQASPTQEARHGR